MNDYETQRRYLTTFRQALTLPASERDDAVREIESHIALAQAEGQSAASVTARLGDARTLAKAYLAEQPRTAPAFGQELRRAGLFVGTGFASLIVIPSLLLTAFSFVAAAVMGIFFGFARTLDPSGFHLFGQNLPWGDWGVGNWQVPPLLSVPYSLVLAVLLSAAALGTWWVLRLYLKTLSRGYHRLRGSSSAT